MEKEIKNYEFKEGDERIFNNTSIELRKQYKLIYSNPTGIDSKLYFKKDKNKTLFNILEKEIYPANPDSVFTLCITNQPMWTGKTWTEKPHLFIYKKEAN